MSGTTIGVFGFTGVALAIIVIIAVVVLIVVTIAFYFLNTDDTFERVHTGVIIGSFASYILGIILVMIALMSWWTWYAWSINDGAGIGVVLGSLIAILIWVFLPLAATKKFV